MPWVRCAFSNVSWSFPPHSWGARHGCIQHKIAPILNCKSFPCGSWKLWQIVKNLGSDAFPSGSMLHLPTFVTTLISAWILAENIARKYYMIQEFVFPLSFPKTMLEIKWVINVFKISRLPSIREYCRVLQSITEYYRVLQTITEYYRVSEINGVLRSFTE